MKILEAISPFVNVAGTCVFCGEICNELAAMGNDVTMAVPDPNAKDGYPVSDSARRVAIREILNGNETFDVVHVNNLWLPELNRVARWARGNGAKVVWSPHGTLAEWAMHHKWLKKKIAWWLFQRRGLINADMIHATADGEVKDIRGNGLSNPIVTAPLGVSLYEQTKCPKVIDGRRTILFLSRIHPVKGLDNLIEAWAKVKRDGWRIVVHGSDKIGYGDKLKALAFAKGVVDSFEVNDPLFGSEKERAYQAASVFVLPSFTENFGSVVIEALAGGTPVIATKGTPWKELEDERCGWWVDIGVEPLANALKEAMSLSDDERRAMGVCGRELVRRKYTWDAVAKNMLDAYKWLIDGGVKPKCVVG